MPLMPIWFLGVGSYYALKNQCAEPKFDTYHSKKIPMHAIHTNTCNTSWHTKITYINTCSNTYHINTYQYVPKYIYQNNNHHMYQFIPLKHNTYQYLNFIPLKYNTYQYWNITLLMPAISQDAELAAQLLSCWCAKPEQASLVHFNGKIRSIMFSNKNIRLLQLCRYKEMWTCIS